MRKRRKGATGAAIYVRVSTNAQASNGVSLAMQEGRLRDYCRARGWTVAGTYRDEGFSAKTTDRPALRRLLQDARAGKFAAVVIYKLDRLTRRVHDVGALISLFEKRGISLGR